MVNNIHQFNKWPLWSFSRNFWYTMLGKIQLFTKQNWPLVVLTLLSLTPLVWYQRGLPIAGGDNFFMLNPGAALDDFLHTWTERINFGFPNSQTYQLFPLVTFWTLLGKFNLSGVTTQILWSISIFLLSTFSIYFLFRYLFSNLRQNYEQALAWGGITAAALYIFNPWVMTDVVTPVARLSQALLPLLVLLWARGLEERRPVRYSLLIGLTSLFLVSTFAQPVSAIAIPITFTIYLLFFLIRTRDFTYGIKFLLLTIFFYLIFNLWWLLPFFAISLDFYSSALSAVKSYNFLIATHIFDTFRFMGFWAFRTVDPNTKVPHIPYAHFYYEPFFIFLSYFIVILAMLPLLFFPKNKQIIFLTALGLFGVFLSKGINDPFGFFYWQIYKRLPIFSIFREPYARFTGLQVFSFSLLLGVSVVSLQEFLVPFFLKSRKVIRLLSIVLWPISLLLVILLLSFPMLNGKVIQDVSWHGHTFEDMHIKIPQEWKNLSAWLKENDPSARILVLPRQSYGKCLKWDSGICSSGPIAPVLISNPVIIYPESNLYFGDSVLRNFYELFQSGTEVDLSPMLGLLNVDYILVQNDYIWSSPLGKLTGPQSIREMLSGQRDLRLKMAFGERLELYEYLKPTKMSPLTFLNSYRVVSGNDDVVIEERIEYQRLNPAKYRLWLDGNKLPRDFVFLRGFNKNWKVYFVPSGFKFRGPWETFFLKSIPDENHFSVNGFANVWTINPNDIGKALNRVELIVEYKVEKFYLIGLVILGVGLISSLLYFSRLKLLK